MRYRDEEPPLVADYIKAVRERVDGRDLALVFEPGRYIVANAGVLLTRSSTSSTPNTKTSPSSTRP